MEATLPIPSMAVTKASLREKNTAGYYPGKPE
jgi:hypothetical protein